VGDEVREVCAVQFSSDRARRQEGLRRAGMQVMVGLRSLDSDRLARARGSWLRCPLCRFVARRPPNLSAVPALSSLPAAFALDVRDDGQAVVSSTSGQVEWVAGLVCVAEPPAREMRSQGRDHGAGVVAPVDSRPLRKHSWTRWPARSSVVNELDGYQVRVTTIDATATKVVVRSGAGSVTTRASDRVLGQRRIGDDGQSIAAAHACETGGEQ
jgi:hypothetical protein